MREERARCSTAMRDQDLLFTVLELGCPSSSSPVIRTKLSHVPAYLDGEYAVGTGRADAAPGNGVSLLFGPPIDE
jgi:hypothetical protein